MAFALSESPAGGIVSGGGRRACALERAPAAPPATKSSRRMRPSLLPPLQVRLAPPAHGTSKKPRTHHKAAAAAPPEVEPATARLRVIHDGWIYAAPSKTSKQIEKATIGKFVDVTGSTKYYLQAKLKNGQTGYISPSDVELVKPTDKIFLLTQDAAVLEAPNRWAEETRRSASKSQRPRDRHRAELFADSDEERSDRIYSGDRDAIASDFSKEVTSMTNDGEFFFGRFAMLCGALAVAIFISTPVFAQQKAIVIELNADRRRRDQTADHHQQIRQLHPQQKHRQ